MEAVPIFRQAIDFIKLAKEAIKDEQYIKFYDKVLTGLENAADALGEPPMYAIKVARLNDAAVQHAEHLAFYLFRVKALTKELEEKFRALASSDDTSAEYKKFEDGINERINKINEEQKEVMKDRQEIDIFTAIINGHTRKEAEAKIAEYNKQAQAMGV